MTIVEFGREEREAILRSIRMWFREELDRDLGEFEAGFLLDFVTEEIGVHFYNRGLADAQAVVRERAETIVDALYEMERLPPRR